MTKPKYTVRSRHVDGSHLVGRYTSYERAVKAIAKKCGSLEWTSPTRGVGMYGDVVTINVPDGAPNPPPLKDWEPDLTPTVAQVKITVEVAPPAPEPVRCVCSDYQLAQVGCDCEAGIPF
jgi:hypothetical protein